MIRHILVGQSWREEALAKSSQIRLMRALQAFVTTAPIGEVRGNLHIRSPSHADHQYHASGNDKLTPVRIEPKFLYTDF